MDLLILYNIPFDELKILLVDDTSKITFLGLLEFLFSWYFVVSSFGSLGPFYQKFKIKC